MLEESPLGRWSKTTSFELFSHALCGRASWRPVQAIVPVTVNDALDRHVPIDLECLDRLCLYGHLGQLQVGGQVIQYLAYREFKVYSAACLQSIV